jgi:hypothetical protein
VNKRDLEAVNNFLEARTLVGLHHLNKRATTQVTKKELMKEIDRRQPSKGKIDKREPSKEKVD